MNTFCASKSNIHVIARGLLIQGSELILCRAKNSQHFFLPGGHIEDGESAQGALVRELREEMGDRSYEVSSFIGVCENIFSVQEGLMQHEVNIVFEVRVPQDMEIKSQEDHIEFLNVPIKDLKNYNILPISLKEGIFEWLDSKKSFFKRMQGIDMENYLYSLPFFADIEVRIAHPKGDFAHENFPESKYAVDFLLDIGTPVHAARGGKVILVKDDSDWHGMDPQRAQEVNMVGIDHGDATGAEYVHLGYKKVSVKVGQTVETGDLLGYTGYSGMMDLPHLHFNVFQFTGKNSGISIPVKFEGNF